MCEVIHHPEHPQRYHVQGSIFYVVLHHKGILYATVLLLQRSQRITARDAVDAIHKVDDVRSPHTMSANITTHHVAQSYYAKTARSACL